ncbi:laccase domain protein YfiH [bacterium BMS3Abin04]|nr:laccase domain protein YfiH [bacterium BMS3Abin04]
MIIIRSVLLDSFPELKFGMSTKVGLNRAAPFYFNMSKTVGDDENLVNENRKSFFDKFGLDLNTVALQKQIHSDIVTIVNDAEKQFESDALITDKPKLGLAISTADCVPVFLYDSKNKVIAGVHSGWRGTEMKIILKTISVLIKKFHSDPKNIYAYIGPSISQKNYEVGIEVAGLFDPKYVLQKEGKYFLDVALANYDMLTSSGILTKNIQRSELCSFDSKILHSYRRDGKKSGRALGVIVMKETNS